MITDELRAAFAGRDLVAFDLDGTLLASHEYAPPAAQESFRRLMAKHGLDHEPPEIDYISAQIGRPWREFYRSLLPPEVQDHYEEFHAGISAVELDTIRSGRARLFDGTQQVLQELADRGYKLALISNASTDYFEAVIDAFELRRWFGFTECLGDRENHPKHLMLSAAMASVDATAACMIGDKPGDFEAAIHHSFPSVAMTHGYGTPDEIAMATVALASMPALLELLPGA